MIPAETLERMTDFERVVGVKWNPGAGGDYEAVYRLADVFNIIDNTGQPVRSHRLGGRGFITLTADLYPPFDLHVWELMESGDYEAAEAEWDRVNDPLAEFEARLVEKSGGQGRTKKALMDAMGRSFGVAPPVFAGEPDGDRRAPHDDGRLWLAGAGGFPWQPRLLSDTWEDDNDG